MPQRWLSASQCSGSSPAFTADDTVNLARSFQKALERNVDVLCSHQSLRTNWTQKNRCIFGSHCSQLYDVTCMTCPSPSTTSRAHKIRFSTTKSTTNPEPNGAQTTLPLLPRDLEPLEPLELVAFPAIFCDGKPMDITPGAASHRLICWVFHL